MRIPNALQPAIRDIATLEVGTAEAIGTTLAELEPVASIEELWGLVRKKNPSLKIEAEKEVLSFLFFIHNVLLEADVQQDLLLKDIAETYKQESQLNADFFQRNCTLLLNTDSCLRILAKALVISHDYAKGYRTSEILSDVRPVFVRKSNPLSYSIVRHILNMQFWNGTKRSEIYLSMDSDDLHQLKKTVETALENEEKISNELRDMDRCVIDLKNDFDTDLY